MCQIILDDLCRLPDPIWDQALLDHPQPCTVGTGVQVRGQQVAGRGDRLLVGVQVAQGGGERAVSSDLAEVVRASQAITSNSSGSPSSCGRHSRPSLHAPCSSTSGCPPPARR